MRMKDEDEEKEENADCCTCTCTCTCDNQVAATCWKRPQHPKGLTSLRSAGTMKQAAA